MEATEALKIAETEIQELRKQVEALKRPKWYERRYFFGWHNWKALIIELIKLYSNQPSKLSKKRVEGGLCFIVFLLGAIQFFHSYVKDIATFVTWAGVLTPFIVYSVYKIQKDKETPKPVDA